MDASGKSGGAWKNDSLPCRLQDIVDDWWRAISLRSEKIDKVGVAASLPCFLDLRIATKRPRWFPELSLLSSRFTTDQGLKIIP